MEMRKEELLAVSVIILIIFSLYYRRLIANIPFNFFKVEKLDELKLVEYDKNVTDELDFKVFSSVERTCKLEVCNQSKDVLLSKGLNDFKEDVSICEQTYAEVLCGDSSVHFRFSKILPVKNETSLNVKDFHVSTDGPKLTVKLEGNYSQKKGSYKLVNFYLDGKLIRSPQYFFQPTESNFSFEETFLLHPGKHLVEVEIGNSKLRKNVFISDGDSILIDYLILVFSILLAVYSKMRYKLNWMWCGLVFLTIFFFLLPVNFQLSRNLGVGYVTALILLLLVIALRKSKFNFSRSRKIKEAFVFSIIITTVFILVMVFIGDAIQTSHYYLRHLDLTYLYGNTKYFDELSYLGREFNYPSQAFFILTSRIARMLSLTPTEIISYFHVILIFLFVFTFYLVTEKIKNWKNKILVCTIILSNYFVFALTSSSALHTLAFLLLNLSILFYTRNKTLSIINLATATSVHLTMLPAFPFFLYAASGFKVKLKDLLKVIILASIISSIFYLPFILKYGIITEAAPTERGFLQSYGILGATGYFSFVIVLIALTLAFGFYKNAKPTFVFLIMLLIYLFVSQRAVLFCLFIFSFLFVKVFNKELHYKPFYLLCLTIVFISLLHTLLFYSGTTNWCECGVANKNCIQPMKFISMYTSSKDSVALKPLFGHLETYYGKRKVLADPFVEYADERKYVAEKTFYQNCDITPLKKYNISIVILDDIGRTRKLDYGDKIYDNGFFHIYRIE